MASQGKRRRRKAQPTATDAPRPVLTLVSPPEPPPSPEPVTWVRLGEFGAEHIVPGIRAALELIKKACSRTGGRYSAAVVAVGVRDQALQLWLALNAAGDVKALIVTHLGRYDTELRVLQLIMAAGSGLSRDDVAEAIERLRDYARTRDCERVEFHGARRGWLRWVRKLGVFGDDDGFSEIGVCGELGV